MSKRLALSLAIFAVLGAASLVIWRARSEVASAGSTLDDASSEAKRASSAAPLVGDDAKVGDAKLAENATAIAARRAALGEPTPFELHFDDAKPVAKADVIAWRGDMFLDRATSDERGRVELALGDGAFDVLVLAPNRVPWISTVEKRERTIELAIPRAETLTGFVTDVGSVVSTKLIVLTITSDTAWIDREPPMSVVAELHRTDRSLPWRTEVAVDATGRFELGGLTSPWTGSIAIDDAHELVGSHWPGKLDKEHVQLFASSPELALEIRAFPLVSGRVVDATGEHGVANAQVRLRRDFKESTLRARFEWERADSEGRFEIPYQAEHGRFADDAAAAHDPLVLVACDANFLRRGERRIEISPLEHSIDLHDVALGEARADTGRTVRFIVMDDDGAPLARAVVEADGITSSPTDGSGICELAVPSGAWNYLVTRVGCDDRRGRFNVDATEVHVRLTRDRATEFDVVDERGAPLQHASVRLAFPTTRRLAAFWDEDERAWMFAAHAQWVSDIGEDASSITIAAENSGVVRTKGLPTDELIGLSVLDAAGSVLAQSSIQLASQESRRQILRCTTPTADLFARVIDASHRPVVNARVAVEAIETTEGPSALTTLHQSRKVFRRDYGVVTTDSVGRVAFRLATASRVAVNVTRPGFETKTVETLIESKSQNELSIELAAESGVHIAIVDANGRSIPGTLVTTGEIVVDRIDRANFVLRQLPSETRELDLSAVVGDRHYRQHISIRDGEAKAIVPAQGSAEFHFSVDPVADAGRTFRVLVDSDDHQVFFLTGEIEVQGANGIARYPALLPGNYSARLEIRNRAHGFESTGKIANFVVDANRTTKAELLK